MSDSPTPADDAKARREARKARILNKGSDRLAKLTKQARGDDAEMLYPSSPSTSKTTAAQPATVEDDDTADPPEIDISQQGAMDADLNRAMEMFAQQRQAQGQGQTPQDPLQQMMAAMMGGTGGGEGQGQNGMPDLSQLLAAMQGGGDAPQNTTGDPANPFTPPKPRGPTLSDRLFSILHVALFSIVGYIFFSSTFAGNVTGQGNPLITQDDELYHSMLEKSRELEYTDRVYKWASLAYYRPSVLDSAYFNVNATSIGLGSDVPILYVLLALTLTLQLLRLTILRSAPPPSSLLFTLASQLPFPTLQWALKLGAKYVNILSTLLDDVALLIFALGGAIIYSVVVSGSARPGLGDADTLRAQSAADVLGSSGAAMGHPEL